MSAKLDLSFSTTLRVKTIVSAISISFISFSDWRQIGTLPKDPSKQRGNFGRLNQSQNKLGFLFRMDIVKGSKNGSRRYIQIWKQAKLF